MLFMPGGIDAGAQRAAARAGDAPGGPSCASIVSFVLAALVALDAVAAGRRPAGRQRQRDRARLLQLVLGPAGVHRRAGHEVRRRSLLQGRQRRRRHPRPQGPHRLLRRRLQAAGRRRQHPQAGRAGQDLRRHRAPGHAAGRGHPRLPRGEPGAAAVPVPGLARHARQEVRLQRHDALRPAVEA